MPHEPSFPAAPSSSSSHLLAPVGAFGPCPNHSRSPAHGPRPRAETVQIPFPHPLPQPSLPPSSSPILFFCSLLFLRPQAIPALAPYFTLPTLFSARILFFLAQSYSSQTSRSAAFFCGAVSVSVCFPITSSSTSSFFLLQISSSILHQLFPFPSSITSSSILFAHPSSLPSLAFFYVSRASTDERAPASATRSWSADRSHLFIGYVICLWICRLDNFR